MAVTGWKTPGTQANVVLGGNAWADLGNVTASDNARATVSLGINEDSDYMRLTNFGFTTADIPSGSTIDGIELQVERVRTSGSANRISDLHIILRKTSGQVGADKANTGTFWTTTEATRTYGGAADLWTTTWSDTDITSSDFGVDFAAQCGNAANGGGVDLIQIRVHYTEVTGDVTANPTGVAGTGSAGSPSVTADTTVSITGVSATGSAGTVEGAPTIFVDITGVEATGGVGSPTIITDATVTPTGVSGTGQVGSPSVSTDATQSLTGVSATGSAGTVTASADVSVALTGVSGTGSVGTLTADAAGDVTVVLSGVSASGGVGDFTVATTSVAAARTKPDGAPGKRRRVKFNGHFYDSIKDRVALARAVQDFLEAREVEPANDDPVTPEPVEVADVVLPQRVDLSKQEIDSLTRVLSALEVQERQLSAYLDQVKAVRAMLDEEEELALLMVA